MCCKGEGKKGGQGVGAEGAHRTHPSAPSRVPMYVLTWEGEKGCARGGGGGQGRGPCQETLACRRSEEHVLVLFSRDEGGEWKRRKPRVVATTTWATGSCGGVGGEWVGGEFDNATSVFNMVAPSVGTRRNNAASQGQVGEVEEPQNFLCWFC